jgi:hypothetical protein
MLLAAATIQRPTAEDVLGQIRHDKLRRLYAYWVACRGEGPAPSRAAIRPEEISDLLQHLMLMDVLEDPPRFRIRLAGTHITSDYGCEITGAFLDQLDLGDHREDVLAQYRWVVDRHRPRVDCWAYAKTDRRWIEYERLILPLSSDGKIIDKLLCGMVIEKTIPSFPTR